MRRLHIVMSLVAWCALVGSALAQGTATVFGTVLDPSGAAVPGVEVSVRNVETNVARATMTTSEGTYVLSQLPVGTYELTARLDGFKTYVEQDIRLQVDEHRQVSVALEVGELAESATVSAQATQVDTRTGTLQEVVDAERIVQIPLNGRNILQLQQLVPGAGGVTGKGQAQNESLSINGSRTNANNYTLDGAENQDPYFNTPAVFPNPDALQEFSIQTSSYSAASGRNAGALMNAVTKSGTNQLRGSLFEFVRNDALNARNFFAAETPPFKRNQFGGTVGGPMRHDRTFFFAAYQGWRERSQPGSQTSIAPTESQRRGDLSSLGKTIVDPLTGAPFPGNIIPEDRLHPAAQQFLDTMVPLPNGPEGLLSFSSGQEFDQDQIITKIDHHLTSDHTLSGRLIWNNDRIQEATGNLPNFFALIDYENWNLTVSDTHIVSPTLLNVVRVTYNDIDRVQLSEVPGNATWTDFGANIPRAFTDEATAAWDTRVDGYFRAFSRFPLNHFRQNFKVSDDLTWVRGRHQLQIGGAVGRSQLDLQEFFRGDPFVRFRATHTGDALADLLLGLPTQIEQIAEVSNDTETWEVALYAQDNWNVASGLTLNLGVRWEPYQPTTDIDDGFSQLRPGQRSERFPTAPEGLVFPGDPGVSGSTLKKRWANVAPRVGFAWDPFGTAKTSVRGGYGIFYSSIRQQALNQISSNQPFSLKLTVNEPPGGLDDPFTETGNPFPFSPPSGDAAQAFAFDTPAALTMWDPDFRNAVVQQWNVNVQHEFLGSYLATIAYVGSKGDHLFRTVELNPALPGEGSVNERRLLAPDFASVTSMQSTGISRYHALQVSLNKRFTGWFSLLASHTWSKLIDDASADGERAVNPFDLSKERGLSQLDLAHRFVGSFIVDLPRFERSSALVKHVLGAWRAAGVVTLESGRPFSVVSGVDNSRSAINRDRADLIGDPALPTDRPRGELVEAYFNADAFAPNPIGTFGTSGRNILRGPGLATLDLALVKEIPLVADHQLELRAELFNLFNRVNLDNPNNNLSSPNVGRITSAGAPRVIQFGLKYAF